MINLSIPKTAGCLLIICLVHINSIVKAQNSVKEPVVQEEKINSLLQKMTLEEKFIKSYIFYTYNMLIRELNYFINQ